MKVGEASVMNPSVWTGGYWPRSMKAGGGGGLWERTLIPCRTCQVEGNNCSMSRQDAKPTQSTMVVATRDVGDLAQGKCGA